MRIPIYVRIVAGLSLRAGGVITGELRVCLDVVVVTHNSLDADKDESDY